MKPENTEKSIVIEKTKLLMVEGQDEVNFFRNLLKFLKISNIQVIETNGVNNYLVKTKLIKVTPGFNDVISIGATRDADNSCERASQSIRSAFINAGLDMQSPRVTFFILPDNNSDGMLEDLCMSSVKFDPAISCLDSYVDCLKSQAILPSNISKVRSQAFLASRKKEIRDVGVAAQVGVWNWDSPEPVP